MNRFYRSQSDGKFTGRHKAEAVCCLLAFLLLLTCERVAGAEDILSALPDTLMRIKQGVVGVGTVLKTRRPPNLLRGTGFVVADGRHVITNAHVIPEKLNEKRNETLAVFAGQGSEADLRQAQVAATDAEHDLVVLKIDGSSLPALSLSNDAKIREGQTIAFTGYPLGAILGLFPATHRGIVSAIVPLVIPPFHGSLIKKSMVESLSAPFYIFQLDATAFPGHSGSPLYDPRTGGVIGIVNMVFVKGKKEAAISDPSGITYAIPVHHAKRLLESIGLTP